MTLNHWVESSSLSGVTSIENPEQQPPFRIFSFPHPNISGHVSAQKESRHKKKRKQPRFAGRRMATILPRNRGLKTRGHRSKTRDSVPFRYASAAPLTQYSHSSVPNRHATSIIIHRLRVQEPSVTRQGGRPRRPSSSFPPIPIPPHHRYSYAPQPFNRRRTAYFDKKQPLLPMFVAGVIS